MARRPPVRRVHVVVAAHDPSFLRLTLLGIAHQDRPADSVVVTCDNDHVAFLPTCKSLAEEWSFKLNVLMRPFVGEPRPAQVRNNGIRHLLAHGATDDDLVVFFDGDSCPRRDALRLHEQFARNADLVIGQRYRMSAPETEAFDEAAFLDGSAPIPLDPKQMEWIDRRHRRGVRQRWLQMVGLSKPHKPKLLGANHAVRMRTLQKINGYDERFMGWGSEDDDLSRRAYRSGAKPVIAINQILVYHQFHPEREQHDEFPEHTHSAAERLRQGFAVRCPHGLLDPVEQPVVQMHPVTPRQSSM